LVAPPAYGHLFPLVPLAWALRAAGHEVLIASCGAAVNAAARAGLAIVNVARGLDVAAVLRRHRAGFSRPFPQPVDAPDDDDESPSVFSELCDAMADGTVHVASSWHADLIVYTPEAAAGLLAATRLDRPAIFVSIGLGHTPALMTRRYAATRATCRRHHVAALKQPDAWIDMSPASLRRQPSDGWPMRYMQYNGGQPLDVDPVRDGRPRVAVTLGTMVPQVFGVTAFKRIVEATRGVEATFVLAHGSDSPRDLGALPPNVEAHSWMPLDALLATSGAAIHHGGFGTTMAVVGAGLPQLVLPHGADHFFNAAVLRRRGAAIVDGEHETVEMIRRLLIDEPLRRAARELSAEVAAMPPPAEVVPKLVGLAA
jgi:UDP:flavonoid glycosyltransferase YjiC (YdhE family)